MTNLNPTASILPSSPADPCRYASIAGQRLAYRDEGSGFPILLGHSYLWNAGMWQPQMEALSRHFRVIATDLWGHGRSDAPPAGTRSLQDMALHHLALLDALGIGECHVVGLSIGGMWAEALAQIAPKRVRKLVLMDTFLGGEPPLSQAKYLALLDQIETIRTIPDVLLDVIAPLFFSPQIDRTSPLYTAFRSSLAALTPERLVESIVPIGRMLFTRGDYLHRLHRLRAADTLILVGEDDIPRPLGESAEMAALIGCQLRAIANAGHISNRENPEAVTRALAEFLAG